MQDVIQQKKAHVGIAIATRFSGAPAVVLQQRRDDAKSFARGHQVTAGGGLEKDELALPRDQALRAGMLRELREEAGSKLANLVAAEMQKAADLCSVVCLYQSAVGKGEDAKYVATFGWDSRLDFSALRKLIVPGSEVKGFTICTDLSTIQPYEERHKKSGVPDGEIRMQGNEITALRKLFADFFSGW